MGECNHLILHCMDYRIQKTVDAWIQKQGYYGDIDVIALGGSCRREEVVLDNIAIGCERHKVKHVILTQHEDCAGYGGRDAFPSREAQLEKLVSDMMGLKQRLKTRHAGIEVSTLLVLQKDDDWEVVEAPSGT
jgi:carbonic anhydrase